jgi:hypothetical protein
MRPVCVITTPQDITAKRVEADLEALGADVIRFDLADFPRHVALDATVDGSGWTGSLTAHGRTVRLEEIGAVWWWHPSPARIDTGSTPAEADWLSREATVGLAGTLAALDCLHVNHPAATQAAQSKAGVLAIAPRFGLSTPATWIGNAPAGARRFAQDLPGGVVCKSIVEPGIDHGDGRHSSLYTRPVPASALDDSIGLGAHQLQHRITKQFEVRLVVVGAAMFPARINAGSDAAREDFRSDYGALTYGYVDLPEDVRRGIASLMAHYRLHYAAIDLLVDARTGAWLLIDLNPAGQHNWLQYELPELGISGALAHLLTHPTAHPRTSPPVPGPSA